MIRPLLIAMRFLTRLPLPMPNQATDRDMGHSLLFYPFAGLVIGLLLASLSWNLNGIAIGVHAAMLLSAWVLLTGGLHLDGLADSTDAWVGGLGDREKTLSIMKDACSGPAAVVILILVLLLKFAALQTLLASHDYSALILAPILGRTAIPLLFLCTPYVRPGGLGAALAEHFPRRQTTIVICAVAGLILALTPLRGLHILLAGCVVWVLLRRTMMRRIGGTTGDTAGAMVELIEVTVLLATMWK